MTTQANESQLNATPDLPAIPATSPPADDTPAAARHMEAVHPVPPNRAEQARRRRLENQTRRLLVGADYRMRSRVRDPDGGDSAASDILEQEKGLRARIRNEKEEGSRKHDRLPPWLRRIPLYVLGFDSALLIYFFAGITNVDWSSPLSFALAVAVVLASMVTLLAYGCLTFADYQLRLQEGRFIPLRPGYAFALPIADHTELSVIGHADLEEAIRRGRHYELHQVTSGRN